MAGEMAPSGSRRSWLSASSISRSLRMAGGDPDDPFHRSAASRDEGDDEENLRWAALEKLPTYDRMRRGIIRKALEEGGDGAATKLTAGEVDVANLDPHEGRELMERVFKAVEDDNERLLRRFRDRLDVEKRKKDLRAASFWSGDRRLAAGPEWDEEASEVDWSRRWCLGGGEASRRSRAQMVSSNGGRQM